MSNLSLITYPHVTPNPFVRNTNEDIFNRSLVYAKKKLQKQTNGTVQPNTYASWCSRERVIL